MVSRKQFIEQAGATCDNWAWSWSFINENEKFVIFGLWDIHDDGDLGMIFAEDWRYDTQGRKKPGYDQSKRHIDLVADSDYGLKIFPMIWSSARMIGGDGPAAIKEFSPILSNRRLVQVGSKWYAADDERPIPGSMADEVADQSFVEGAVTTVTVNAYERNPKARKACLEHYGFSCQICSFDFEKKYGEIGHAFIHVHHLIPLSETDGEYTIDPINDLMPVCPNCHAIIHRARPALMPEQIRNCLLNKTKQ
jgi:5-methylcytosine-specific restriction enzyme A